MISWIQDRLIRHGRWIFITLLAIIIFAFVFTIGNTPGCTTRDTNYQAMTFYGYDLNAPSDMTMVTEKVTLSNMINTARPIQNDSQFQSLATNRIALLHLADLIGVPNPTESELSAHIQELLLFRGPDGNFSPDSYQRFLDNLAADTSTPKGIFTAVVNEDYRLQQIAAALSGPGYVLPTEAELQTLRNKTNFSLSIADFSYATFEPEITIDETQLNEYFASNTLNYEIPERIQANYILFKSEDFADDIATADEQALRDHFISNRAKFAAAFDAQQPEPAEGETKETVTFEKVRIEVAASYAVEAAKRAANEAAQNFAFTLYDQAIPQSSEAYNELLAKYGVTAIEIAPYTAAQVSARGLSSEMLTAGFNLSEKRYYSDPYPIGENFGVLIQTGRIDPEIPEFEAVAEQVTNDFKAEEKRRLFSEKGISLKATLSAALEAGTDFKTAAETAGLTITQFQDFTPENPPAELQRDALQQAQNMEAKELSEMVRTRQGDGRFIYIDEKSAPALAANDEELEQSRKYLAQFSAYISSSGLINELVTAGLPEPEETAE